MFDMMEGAWRRGPRRTRPRRWSSASRTPGWARPGSRRTMNPELDVRCDADLFVDRLYRVGEPDGPEAYVAAQLSRFVCDMNRDPDDVAPGAVPEHPAPRNADGRGFIWAVTTTGAPDPGPSADASTSGASGPRSTPPITRRCRGRSAAPATSSGSPSWSTGTRCRRAAAPATRTPGRPAPTSSPAIATGTSCAPALSALVDAPLRGGGLARAPQQSVQGRVHHRAPRPPGRRRPRHPDRAAPRPLHGRGDASRSPSRGSIGCAGSSPGCWQSCATFNP